MIILWITLTIIAVFALYCLVPNFIARNYNKSIKRTISRKNGIVLSFDDGPSAKYTEELLDVLKQNNVKACFFMVAKRAKEEPDIVKKIQKEGHMICSHGYEHKSAWLSLPSYVKKDFRKANEIFSSLDIEIKKFRPPWGTFNLLTVFYAKKYDLDIILWRVNAADWSNKTSIEDIKERLISRVRWGDIICLHDAGGADNAPKRTIAALKEVIPELKNKGFRFVLLEDKSGK
jgi:peptidoglycan/xylan/chitin deacetylase (PgdA/CDA1 family)